MAAAATIAEAQRPKDTSICDYYTTALLKENTAKNQLTLLTLVVNTVVIGNCKSPLEVYPQVVPWTQAGGSHSHNILHT